MEVSQVSLRLADAFGEGVFTENCPTREALTRVTSKWAPLLLAALSDGEPLRWNELRRRAVGITEKMLAQTLRTLEEDGYCTARPVRSCPRTWSTRSPRTARSSPSGCWR